MTSQKNNEKHIEGASWIWLGRMLGKTEPSQADKAEECILKGIKILEELQIKPWSTQGYLYLGEFYCDSGQSEKALENLKTVKGMFREMGMDYWLGKTLEGLAEL